MIEDCKDPSICARVASISNEAIGMLDEFEKDVAHLIPVYPVAAKAGKKRNNTNGSGLGGNFKPGTEPKTGVKLWYYKPKEFSQLSQEMMGEPKELRPPHKGKGKGNPRGGGDNHPKKGKGKKNRFKKTKGRVAAAIKQHLEDKAKLKEKGRWGDHRNHKDNLLGSTCF